MAEENYLKYYDLEHYLFDEVSSNFNQNQTLDAFDFFCIVIWKANRAKSRIANKLLNHDDHTRDLKKAVDNLLKEITGAANDKEKLFVLIKQWDFRLPMASAILSVLYPQNFTVYDVRVCEVLKKDGADFSDAQYKANFEILWNRYAEYREKVKCMVPQISDLRDKDRFLWGKSFAKQLRDDIENGFGRLADMDEIEG